MRVKFDPEEDATETSCANFVDQRGWCMKSGHCKRLLKPKRGKAALRAEIQGQGKEVIRGRSAFSRTIGHRGKSTRGHSPEWRGKYGADYRSKTRRTKLRKIAISDAREASHSSQGHSMVKAIDDYMTGAEDPNEISFWNEHWNEEFESDSCIGQASSLDEESSPSLSDLESLCESLSSSPSTAVSLPETHKNLTSSMLKEGMESSFPTPWELAMARAETAAWLYELFLKEKGEPIPQPLSKQQKVSSRDKRVKKPKKIKTRPFDESDLWRFHKTLVSWSREQLAGKKMEGGAAVFHRFRKDFLVRHGMQVCAGLKSCFQGPIQLEPTPLDAVVEQRFLEGISGRLDGTWRPAFHGTSNRNLPSIYKRGLLIPGVGNELRVSHGSAHGLGIFAAAVSNAYLSWGFCDAGNASMLVCAVLDDSLNTAESTFCGRFQMRSQSANIKRVGGAFVVFEPTRIAPLFVASRYQAPSHESPLLEGEARQNKRGPCSSIGRRANGRAADILRRRLIALNGHSVALCPRTKERKKDAELLRARRTQYMTRA